MTRPDTPLPVRVWLSNRKHARGFQTAAHAVAWTDRQVEVRYLDDEGREAFAWVWAAAVERDPDAQV